MKFVRPSSQKTACPLMSVESSISVKKHKASHSVSQYLCVIVVQFRRMRNHKSCYLVFQISQTRLWLPHIYQRNQRQSSSVVVTKKQQSNACSTLLSNDWQPFCLKKNNKHLIYVKNVQQQNKFSVWTSVFTAVCPFQHLWHQWPTSHSSLHPRYVSTASAADRSSTPTS